VAGMAYHNVRAVGPLPPALRVPGAALSIPAQRRHRIPLPAGRG
jgi:hypothetical protein